MKTIIFKGPFSDQDVKELMQALRVCEQRQPEHNFSMLVESHDEEQEVDLKQKLLDMFPALKDVPVEVRVLKK
jgi:hypothetical protein